jgi:hypothetical protein
VTNRRKLEVTVVVAGLLGLLALFALVLWDFTRFL